MSAHHQKHRDFSLDKYSAYEWRLEIGSPRFNKPGVAFILTALDVEHLRALLSQPRGGSIEGKPLPASAIEAA